jgi:hypothetical protein
VSCLASRSPTPCFCSWGCICLCHNASMALCLFSITLYAHHPLRPRRMQACSRFYA